MASDKQEQSQSWQQGVLLYVHDLMRMLMVVMLLFLVVFRVILVTGDSMYSTLWDGDYLLLVSRMFSPEPKQGDIVVISKQSFDDGSPIVKRVIATEGQQVDIDFESGTVYVDDIPLTEEYTHQKTTDPEGTVFPLTVEEGHIFVLGDNRGVSLDSRSPMIGQIDRREVLGKAFVLMIPGTHHGQLSPDYSRTGAIH